MAKTNYNGTASLGASAQVAPENNARVSFYFFADGADMTLNFGAAATADNILKVKSNTNIMLAKGGPFPIEKAINVFCDSATKYNAQAEE